MSRLTADIALAQNFVGAAMTNIWMDVVACVFYVALLFLAVQQIEGHVLVPLVVAVPVGFVTVLLFVPYALLLVHSFWRLSGGAITHEFTLDNYRRLFGTPLYPNTILFSAGIALRVTLVSLLLAYPLAYLLAFKVRRHRTLMYMAVIIPLWVSYLVRAYAWKIILGQEGILNGLLQAAGLIRYFDAEEETSIKIDPRIVLAASFGTAIIVLAITLIWPLR